MNHSPLPAVSHLQFVVLHLLGHKHHSPGKQLREKLAELGITYKGPAFYQFMDRLERDKYIIGDYDKSVVDGQMIKQRRYQITARGLQAVNFTRLFYKNWNV